MSNFADLVYFVFIYIFRYFLLSASQYIVLFMNKNNKMYIYIINFLACILIKKVSINHIITDGAALYS